MRRSIDRRDVDDLELAGLAKFLAYEIAAPHQPIMFVSLRSIELPGKAGVDHLEIEHRKFWRLGCGPRDEAYKDRQQKANTPSKERHRQIPSRCNDKMQGCKSRRSGLVSGKVLRTRKAAR